MDWEFRITTNRLEPFPVLNKPNHSIWQRCKFLNNRKYKDFKLNVIECLKDETIKGKKTEKKFVSVTNIEANKNNVRQLCDAGRQRWGIEHSFDIQKNHGYGLKHNDRFNNTHLGIIGNNK